MRVQFALATALGLAAAGCADPSATLAPADPRFELSADAKATSGKTLRILASTTTLAAPGDSLQLRTIAASGADTIWSSPNVRWSSSGTAVVRVSPSGTVTAVAAGTADVAAAYTWRGRVNVDTVTLTVAGGPGAPSKPSPPAPPSGGSGTDVQPQSGDAELPRVLLNTTMPARGTGRILTVAAGGRLQAAIDSARMGDEIVLQAGATWVGHYTLPAKTGSGWVIIRTSAEQSLPAPGTRVTPADAPKFARIVTPDAAPAIETELRAHHYRLIGLEITASDAVTWQGGLLRFGLSGSPQTSTSVVPNWLVLDRSWVHGHAGMHTKRCMTLNSASSAVIDSRLERCHGKGNDTQAIIGWNGPGPFKIVNNYLADASEVIMFGGGYPTISGLIPSDIEIRGNHIEQTPVMHQWLVKNLVELKTAQRVLVDGNVIENVWKDGQVGFAFNLKSSGDCSWCATRHVTLRNNYVANAPGGIAFTGMDLGAGKDEALHHVVVRGNQFVNIGWRLFQMAAGGGFKMTDFVLEQNTGGAGQNLIFFEGTSVLRLRIRYNAFSTGSYGIKGSGYAEGTGTLHHWAPSATVTSNIFAGASGGEYPTGNFEVPALAGGPPSAGGVRIGVDAARITAVRAVE